jgi:uncharacterized lipoprotein YddW (UPF0748 family)
MLLSSSGRGLMMKKFATVMALVLVLGLWAGVCFGEGRAVWLNVGSLPAEPAGVEALVRSLAEANFNMIFPQVFYHGQTIYPSRVGKQNPKFNGSDPLQVLIEAAKSHGMEVHPWLDTLYVGYKTPGAILEEHPHWAAQGVDGEKGHGPLGAERYWLTPAETEVRSFLGALAEELATKYDIDGIHLDYIRYPEPQNGDFGYEPVAQRKFQEETGLDCLELYPEGDYEVYARWNKWRARQVTELLRQIRTKACSVDSSLLISAAVSPTGMPFKSYPGLLQPWADWASEGLVDFLVPMTYSSRLDEVRGMIRWVRSQAPQVPVYAGLQLWKLPTPDYAMLQVEAARREGASGVALFAMAYLNPTLLDALSEGPFVQPTSPSLEAGEALALVGEPPFVMVPRVSAPTDKDRYVWLDGFTFITGEGPVDWPMECGLAHDGERLYVAFRLEYGSPLATVAQRDGPVFYDDAVEIFIHPQKDAGLYYHLAVNALGTRYDAHILDGPGWDGNWQAEARPLPEGWGGLVTIPFLSLGGLPDGENQWAFNVGIGRAGKFASWAPMPGIFHAPGFLGALVLE